MNQIALKFIAAHEVSDVSNPPLESYWDAIGRIWTIGFGSTGSDIVEGTKWTNQQCWARLGQNMQQAENTVRAAIHVSLSDKAMAALIDLEYNAGIPIHSTVYDLINSGTMGPERRCDVAHAILQWDHGGAEKHEIPGLLKRRMEEAILWLDGTS